ncbi:MAG: SDR family NAD(P)-dependent oxidoreductase, partial [Rhodobacterales bacterium]|nr:SDR family NAD(P)-dependent oxidoreductase [Rhodobacterales bacterium]
DLAARLPGFRVHLERATKAVDAHLDRPLAQVWDSEDIHNTRYTQPALFALEWALARTFLDLGVQPVALLGHSIGEWTAAAIGGALSLEDAALAVCARGAAMADQPGGGAMVALRAPEEDVEEALSMYPSVEIAAVNGPGDVVISGDAKAVQDLADALSVQGFQHRTLTVSHAFHSAHIGGAMTAFTQALSGLSLAAPAIPVISNVDGQDLGDRAASPAYWASQATGAVRFSDGLQALEDLGVDTLIEVGPRPALLALAGRAGRSFQLIATQQSDQDSLQSFLTAVGTLWNAGANLTLTSLYGPGPTVRVPTTAWQRRRHWVDTVHTRADVLPAPRWDTVWRRVDPQAGTGDVVQIAATDGKEALQHGIHALTNHKTGRLVLHAHALAAQVLRGLLAVAAIERPDLDVLLIDAPLDQPDAIDILAVSDCNEPVIRWQDGDWFGARWIQSDRADNFTVKPGQTWVVTGARGALGRRVARWLADAGAETLLLISRGPPDAAATRLLGDANVRWIQADVADPDALADALGQAPTVIAGAIHCAGVQRAGWLKNIDLAQISEVWDGKVIGAQNLAVELPDQARLVLFGSSTSTLGLPAQGAYAATNAALRGIAFTRSGPTTHIGWGPWKTGMAADHGWAKTGVQPLGDDEALAGLGGVLADPQLRSTDLIRIDIDAFTAHRGPLAVLGATAVAPPAVASVLASTAPGARLALVQAWTLEDVSGILGHDVDATHGFFDAGLDSLGAVELARRLGKRLSIAVSPTAAFDHPTPAALAQALLNRLQRDDGPAEHVQPTDLGGDVAIIGLDCRFAGAPDPDAFWNLLSQGSSAITEVPEARWDLADWYAPQPSPPNKMYARHGGFVDGIDQIDPDFFGMSPREDVGIDPQQRLLLQSAWRTLDHAGQAGSAEGSKTAVYVGIAERGWLRRFSGDTLYRDAWSGTGAESSFAAGRIAHALGLHGPAISLNTTCSSSLVALHLGVQALQRGECDQALVGGVHLMLDPQNSAYLCQLGALSPTGRCHTFDAAADGYVRGEGVGMVLLKPLADAQRDGDRVLAVIKGTATNHDGHASGLTVPSGAAQQQVMRDALAASGLSSNDIGYLQAHGTGTPLGDPIEINAVQAVYGPRTSPLAVGTAKTHIGHTELASGAAGLIAAILALQNKSLPAHHLNEVNPDLNLEGLLLPAQTQPWESTGPRRAAISAFGLSGTNAHVILEEAPKRAPEDVEIGPWRLLPIAAQHPDTAIWEVYQPVATSVLAASLPSRAHLRYRSAVVSCKEVLLPTDQTHLQRSGRRPQAAFLFTGQGAQYGGMHRDWLVFPAFAAALHQACDAVSVHLGEDLFATLDDDEALGHTRLTQPAMFAIGVALAAQWRAWGIQPVAVSGHSIGELTAAHVAGCLSLEDAAQLVVKRGALMNALPEDGAMAAVLASEAQVREILGGDVDIAGGNHAAETVISGRIETVEAVLGTAESKGLDVRRLKVSHAFHSRLLDPMLDAWTEAVSAVTWSPPTVPFVSNLTGTTVSDQLSNPHFWRQHARDAVRFADGIQALRDLGCDAFIECGPHPVLLGMGRQSLEDAADLRWLPSGRRKQDNTQTLLRALGDWWMAGGDVDFKAVQSGSPSVLPAYPLRNRRFWPENDQYQRAAWTYTVDWKDAPAPVVTTPANGWVVLGNTDLAVALRTSLSATDSVDNLDSKAIVDLRPLDSGDAQAHVLCARDVALLAAQAADCRVWWVTQGAAYDGFNADQAALWGWARAFFAEHPRSRGGLVDVDVHTDALALTAALGTDALVLRGDQRHQPVLTQTPVHGTAEVSGAWLITGGLGGLGDHVARWLQQKGAQTLLLTATRPLPDRAEWNSQTGDTARRCTLVTDLEAAGCTVHVGAFDAADPKALGAFLGDTQLQGALHLAGRTTPQTLNESDVDTVRGTLHGKVDGAATLDRWLREHAPEAKLVLFGSIGGVWGSASLSAYGAANAYVDALAHQRRSDGLHGLSVDWGPWGGGGMVDADRADRLARMGQQLIDPAKALRVLDAALAQDLTQLVAARVNWDRFCTLVEATGPQSLFDRLRPKAMPPLAQALPVDVSAPVRSEEALTAWVTETLTGQARAVLRLDGDTPLDPMQPLLDLGFDSLMATELNQALLKEGIELPVGRLLGGPSIDELVTMALARMAPPPSTKEVGATAVEDDVPVQLMWFLTAAFMLGAAVATAVGFALSQFAS